MTHTNRCRSYRLEAQNSRNISPWNRQCPHPAKGTVPMRDGSEIVELPACGKHIRLHENGLRAVQAYIQSSDKYESPVVR